MMTKSTKTICIVDADRDLLSLLAAALALEGIRVVAISRTRDALTKLSLQKFAAIVIDSDLKLERSSDVFLAAVDPGGLNARTPIVVMTANLDSEVPQPATTAVKAVLTKPFNIDALFGTLRAVLSP
jgi:DNA-binding NtrC family response regulator